MNTVYLMILETINFWGFDKYSVLAFKNSLYLLNLNAGEMGGNILVDETRPAMNGYIGVYLLIDTLLL